MNKTVAIHQPHYFPWLGYLDKMAKVDEFIVMDDVQFTDGSPMSRNKLLQIDGQSKLLSLCVAKKGYMDKPTKELKLSNWPKTRKKHRSFIEMNYKRTPYYDEIMSQVLPIFETDFATLLEVDLATMNVLRDIFDIETPLIMQSTLAYDTQAKNNDLVLSLCEAIGADGYLSGRGAREYMDDESFERSGVTVRYQLFESPVYAQCRQQEFVSGLSSLDLAFQYGIEGARSVFRSNMRREMW